MDDITSFGAWLKRRRQVLGLTQEELARPVGCAVVTIRKMGFNPARPEELHRTSVRLIRVLLGVQIRYIYGFRQRYAHAGV